VSTYKIFRRDDRDESLSTHTKWVIKYSNIKNQRLETPNMSHRSKHARIKRTLIK